MDPIGARIRGHRKTRGLSQQELSNRAGVTLSLISKVEQGRISDLHLSTLAGLASALDLTVAELIGESAPKDQPSLFNNTEQRREEEERRRALNVYLALYTPITLLAERWERVAASRTLSESEAEAMVDDYHAMFAAMAEAERRLGDMPHAEFERAGAEIARAMRRFYDVTEMVFEKAAADNVYDLQALKAKRDRAA